MRSSDLGSSGPDCQYQPFSVISRYAPCEEKPTCDSIVCYDDVRCLLARSTAPIVAGCRSSLGKDLYCICPDNSDHEPFIRSLLYRFHKLNFPVKQTKMASSNSTSDLTDDSGTMSTTTAVITTTASSGGLSGGAIAGIVIGVLAFIILVSIAVFLAIRYVRDRRKNHGEYRPQWEEEHHAKDLPHLQPPAIEGLI